MIRCLSCRHEEPFGALFCSECGEKLPLSDQPPYSTSDAVESPTDKVSVDQPDLGNTKPLWDSGMALHLVDFGEIFPLVGGSEIVIGRAGDGQPLMPDVDLEPYHAYESGVSRLHLFIRVDEDHVSVMDLFSANGTFLNGKKLEPYSAHAIKKGDILTLGKFRIQVLVKT